VHENDHASLQNKLRNHCAETKRPANFAARATVRGQDRSHCLAFEERTDLLTEGAGDSPSLTPAAWMIESLMLMVH